MNAAAIGAIDVALFAVIILAAFGLAREIRKLRAAWREKQLLKRVALEMVQHDLSTGKVTPVRLTEEGKLFAKIATDHCPDCGGKGFYAGPSGGMSQNIYCQNRECRSAFNVTAFTETEGIVERIGKKDPEWYVGAAI